MSVLETTTSLSQAEPLASSSQAAPLSYEEFERVRREKENDRRSHFKPHPKKRRPVSVIIMIITDTGRLFLTSSLLAGTMTLVAKQCTTGVTNDELIISPGISITMQYKRLDTIWAITEIVLISYTTHLCVYGDD